MPVYLSVCMKIIEVQPIGRPAPAPAQLSIAFLYTHVRIRTIENTSNFVFIFDQT